MTRHVLSLPLGYSLPDASTMEDGEALIQGGQVRVAKDGAWNSAPGGAGVFRGPWSSSASYSTNDTVLRNGTVYYTFFDQGVQDHWEASWWIPIATLQTPRGDFDPDINPAYQPGDTAQDDDGVLYRRLMPGQATELAPSTSPTGPVVVAESWGGDDTRTLPVGSVYSHTFFNMGGGSVSAVTGMEVQRDTDAGEVWDGDSVFLIVTQTDWYAASGAGGTALVGDIPVLATGVLVGDPIEDGDIARTWVDLTFAEGAVDLTYKQIVVITDRRLVFNTDPPPVQTSLSLGGMQFYSSDNIGDSFADYVGSLFPSSSSVWMSFTVQEPLWEVLYTPRPAP